MKRRVVASSNVLPDAERIHEHLGDIETMAYNCGYNMDVESDGYSFSIYFETSESLMPSISVAISRTKDKYNRDTFVFEPSLSFPDILYDEMEYHDTAHYWIGKWQNVARLVDYLICNPYTPEAYVDDEDDEA